MCNTARNEMNINTENSDNSSESDKGRRIINHLTEVFANHYYNITYPPKSNIVVAEVDHKDKAIERIRGLFTDVLEWQQANKATVDQYKKQLKQSQEKAKENVGDVDSSSSDESGDQSSSPCVEGVENIAIGHKGDNKEAKNKKQQKHKNVNKNQKKNGNANKNDNSGNEASESPGRGLGKMKKKRKDGDDKQEGPDGGKESSHSKDEI